jgi:hypothetical protein
MTSGSHYCRKANDKQITVRRVLDSLWLFLSVEVEGWGSVRRIDVLKEIDWGGGLGAEVELLSFKVFVNFFLCVITSLPCLSPTNRIPLLRNITHSLLLDMNPSRRLFISHNFSVSNLRKGNKISKAKGQAVHHKVICSIAFSDREWEGYEKVGWGLYINCI